MWRCRWSPFCWRCLSASRCSAAASGGTYFAIITQAIAAILTILIIGQQGYTGGVNGITDLRTLHGWDIRSDHAKDILYFVNAAAC